MTTIISNDLINATMTTIDTLVDVVVVASLVANNTTSIVGGGIIDTANIFAAAAAGPVCEACGWLAAIGSMIAFGSFGVPIKSEACQRVQVDPLVFQSYKTIMCFLTSWIILLFGYKFTFTPWGIVSGLFWVPGGVATILAVQCAGLAAAIGIGSTGIVLVSFIWGIFIFDEPVNSKAGACFAVALMMTGLYGMAYFSTPYKETILTTHSLSSSSSTSLHTSEISSDETSFSTSDAVAGIRSKRRNRKGDYRDISQGTDPIHIDDTNAICPDDDDDVIDHDVTQDHTLSQDPVVSAAATVDEEEDYIDGIFAPSDFNRPSPSSSSDVIVITFGERIMKLPKRQVGICAAVFNGVWGGSIMAPMKWCQREDTTGIGFLLSFAIGASIVNFGLWVVRYLYLVMFAPTSGDERNVNRWYQAYLLLPSFHLRELWCAGATCGLLWSIGNFFSLISVKYLGQGVGYSVIQAAMLVAGMWGIGYFREVTKPAAICKWFLSAILTVSGILLLSYEHHAAK